MLRVLYINNNGAGFADYVEVAEGTTVEKFFSGQQPGQQPADYLIRVNRLPAAKEALKSAARFIRRRIFR